MSLRRRLVAASLLGALGLVLYSPSASAHANLRSSSPRDGAQLDRAPEALTLTFTEPPEPSFSEVRVLDPSAAPVTDGAPRVAPSDRFTLEVPLQSLDRGSYTVTWRTVSAVDGHPSAGAFSFGVGVPATSALPQSAGTRVPATSLREVVGRIAFLGGLTMLVGAASVAVWVFGGTPSSVRAFTAWGWLVGALGLVVLAAAQVRAASVNLATVLATSVGRALELRTVGLAVAGAGLLLLWRAEDRRARFGYILVVVGGAGTILAHVAAGHAAASGAGALEVLSQWVHVVAVSIWLGGLGALLVGLRGAAAPARGAWVRRFSTIAGIMLVLVGASGVVRALDEIHGWAELFGSTYGRLVLFKICLLVALATLGAVNRYRHVPRVESSIGGLLKVGRAELVLALVTITAAGVLASVAPPARTEAAAGEPQSLVVNGSDFATSMRARLEISPGYAGANSFLLQLRDYDTGEPIGARRVSARFSFLGQTGIGPSTLRLRRGGAGAYSAKATNLSLDGSWRVTVTVERATGSVEIPLRFTTRCRARPLAQPGRATIDVLELPDGASFQGYLQPGRAGLNQIHATFLASDDKELKVGDDVTIEATAAGHAHAFRATRLGPGHFVANADLVPGSWRFDVSARSTRSGPLTGCFEESITP